MGEGIYHVASTSISFRTGCLKLGTQSFCRCQFQINPQSARDIGRQYLIDAARAGPRLWRPQGRAQAIAIGEKFKKSGVTFDTIFSSQWCRCIETAELLKMGPVQEFVGLNSFFQRYAKRDEPLQKLEQKLSSLDPDGLYLMVTHQVVIQAVAQLSVSSGECVAYNFQSEQAVKLQIN